MARRVDDLELALHIMAGDDPSDPLTFPVRLGKSSEVDMTQLNFSAWDGSGMPDTPAPTNDTLEVLENVAKVLTKLGVKRVAQGPPPIEGLQDIYDAVYDPEVIVPDPQMEVPLLKPDAQAHRYFLARRARISKERKNEARTSLLPRFQTAWLKYLENVDVIVSPVCSLPAMKHHTTWDNIFAFNFTLATSMVPKVPAGSIRCGTSKVDNLPIGIQVIGKPYREDIVLKVMKVLENEFGGWRA